MESYHHATAFIFQCVSEISGTQDEGYHKPEDVKLKIIPDKASVNH